ncbi:hypothetical protein AVT69_gp065 [Pseudomonas phage PhiPA3]|uniref:Uncharacterized protein 064 n=1 Tax=Pseudomonas phage PhiPA3 TaxID=998086 RepID=F8SJU6_BPPA3|nr:hypothetical protein AVT69_gp065 [Pseudomonas phage PhiPA3]AEH03491.1 hypothetical protein [Pseudomonas phage PhiPA3]
MSLTLDCYKEVLTSLSCVFDDDGLISVEAPTGSAKPVKVEGRRLVLPTKEWLRKGFGEDYQPFHPLCESLSRRGTSPVMQFIQRSVKANLSHIVVFMATNLLRIAVDQSTHKDLPPDTTDFLKKLADADKSCLTAFEKLIGSAVKKNRLMTVYLKNGGTFDGKKVDRMAIVRFPILEDLASESKEVLGIALTKKQRKVITALLRLVVPFGDNPEEYAYGTRSRVAPYFESILHAYHKIATVLNQLIHHYAVPLHMPIKPIELYDLKMLESFGKIYNEIPVLAGNEGGHSDTPEEAAGTTEQARAATQPTATQTVQPSRTPAVTQQPVATTVAQPAHGKTVSMSDFMAAQNPAPMMAVNTMVNPMTMGGMNSGMMGMGQPMMSPMAPAMMPMGQPTGGMYAPTNTLLPWQAQQQQMMQAQQPANPFAAAIAPMTTGGGLGLL